MNERIDIESFFVGNEWKTRFENQEEINRHLARQILLLEKNIEQAKEEQKTGLFDHSLWCKILFFFKRISSQNSGNQGRSQWSKRNVRDDFLCLLDFSKVNKDVLTVAENEKKNLLSQLRDYEWRLEQENKVSFLSEKTADLCTAWDFLGLS